jgi:SET domain-containing protein
MTARAKRPWFEVRGSAIQGRGVFALRHIPQDTWIVQYTGETITHEESDRRYDDDAMRRHHTFLFVLDDHHVIDAAVGGSDARYINHSCEPNCEAVYEEDDGEIWIVAVRDIQPGEELTYDYGYTVEMESWEEARRLYPCRCGAPTCRGTILKLA